MNLSNIFEKSDGGDIFDFSYKTSFSKSKYDLEIIKEASLVPIDNSTSLTSHIRGLFNKGNNYNDEIGKHPDFTSLTDGETKKQYVLSVFLDIEGSTNLIFKYPLEQVRIIKNRILKSAIQIFQSFDGHIHRLQGDAVFAYFGDSTKTIPDSIINALNACSILQLYINSYIKDQFRRNEVTPVNVRIGIDLGYEEDVLWSMYGIDKCSEITTTSLHTDLAAKLQSKCNPNEIYVGENLVNHIDIPNEFIENMGYIINNSKKQYKMYKFIWNRYKDSFHFINDGGIFNNVELKCNYYTDDTGSTPYVSNSCALSKDISLKFVLEGLSDPELYSIKWVVKNRGKEISNSSITGIEEFEMEDYRNEKYCDQLTAYTGHHYMECTLSFGSITESKLLGIYINENNIFSSRSVD